MPLILAALVAIVALATPSGRRRRRTIDPTKLITTAQAMERYQLSRRTFDRLAERGDVVVYYRRPARQRYWDPDDLDALWEVVER